MKHHIAACSVMVVATLLIMVGCTKRAGKAREWAGGEADSFYTWRAAMQVYGYQPERALQIIDSAVIVGNMSEVWADANRARVYSMTQMNEQVDSLLGGSKGAGLERGKTICEQLLKHDSLKTNLKLKQEVLDILVYTERQLQDTVEWLQRAQELVEVYHQMGPEKETDALRTEAEIGALCRPKLYAIYMTTTFMLLLLAIIAVLSVVVAVLLWRNLHHQRELRDKNDVIIREIRENTLLRDELRDAWRKNYCR